MEHPFDYQEQDLEEPLYGIRTALIRIYTPNGRLGSGLAAASRLSFVVIEFLSVLWARHRFTIKHATRRAAPIFFVCVETYFFFF